MTRPAWSTHNGPRGHSERERRLEGQPHGRDKSTSNEGQGRMKMGGTTGTKSSDLATGEDTAKTKGTERMDQDNRDDIEI